MWWCGECDFLSLYLCIAVGPRPSLSPLCIALGIWTRLLTPPTPSLLLASAAPFALFPWAPHHCPSTGKRGWARGPHRLSGWCSRQPRGLRNNRTSNEARTWRCRARFPSGPEGSDYQSPPWDIGLCSGSHVGSQGTYLCLTADRATDWLQDRMNMSSPHGVFQNRRVGLAFYFPTPSPIPICAVDNGLP